MNTLKKALDWIAKARQDHGLTPAQKTKVRGVRNAHHQKVPQAIHSEPITDDTDGRQPKEKRSTSAQGYRVGQSRLRSGGAAHKRGEAMRVLEQMRVQPKPKLPKTKVTKSNPYR